MREVRCAPGRRDLSLSGLWKRDTAGRCGLRSLWSPAGGFHFSKEGGLRQENHCRCLRDPLGTLGVHKFVLGYTQEGVILLACTIGGYLLGFVGSMFVIGCVFFLAPMAASIIGLIEGIIYLTKSDEEFVSLYVTNKKAWF